MTTMTTPRRWATRHQLGLEFTGTTMLAADAVYELDLDVESSEILNRLLEVEITVTRQMREDGVLRLALPEARKLRELLNSLPLTDPAPEGTIDE